MSKKQKRNWWLGLGAGLMTIGTITGIAVPFSMHHTSNSNVLKPSANINNSTTNSTTSSTINSGTGFSRTLKKTSNLMTLTLHNNLNTINTYNNMLTAIINTNGSASLSATLNTDTNLDVSNVSINWYYSTSANYDGTLLTNSDTGISFVKNTLVVAQSFLNSKINNSNGVVYFYAQITFSSNGYSEYVNSGYYVLTNNSPTITQTINDTTNTPTALMIGTKAVLGVNINNPDTSSNNYSNISYSIGSNSTNENTGINYNSMTANSTSINITSGLTFYFIQIAYDYFNVQFSVVSSAYVLLGINSKIDVMQNNKSITDSTNITSINIANGDASLSATISEPNSNSSTLPYNIQTVTWHEINSDTLPKTYTNSTLVTTGVSNNVLTLTSKNVATNTPYFYYANVTFSQDGYIFNTTLTPVYVINLSTNDSATNNTNTTNKQANITAPNLNISQSINNENVLGINVTNNETANLSISYNNTSISNVTYTWYENSTNSFNTASKISNDNSSFKASNTTSNSLKYYFVTITYTYENTTFTTKAYSFLVTNIVLSVTNEYHHGGIYAHYTSSCSLAQNIINVASSVTYSYNVKNDITQRDAYSSNGYSSKNNSVSGSYNRGTHYTANFSAKIVIDGIILIINGSSEFYA